ncbi:MAG: hypothetical protein COW07_08090, partial [Hydrogenophilales bacterium CG12_big_fil_rev_8_21_14_0_65_61_21]
TPIQALKKWQTEKPELFVKRVYKQAGLDTRQLQFRVMRRSREEPLAVRWSKEGAGDVSSNGSSSIGV